MKKIISVLLVVLLLFSFAACGKRNGDSSAANASGSSETEKASTKGTVKVSFPLSLLGEEDRNDLDAYCEKYGFKSAKVNSDGTVTIKMSSLSRDLLLTQIGMESIQGIYSVAESGAFPYVKKIKSFDDKNFAEVSVLVNRAKFSSADSALVMKLTIAQSCLTYQAYAEIEEPKVKITVIDNKTKETIEEKEFTNSDIQ